MLDSPPPPQQPPCRGVGACCEHNRACRSALLLASSLAAHRGLELLVRAYPQLLFGGSSLEAQQPSCGHILRCMPCCVLCSTEHQPSCSPSAGHPHTCRFQRHFPWAQQKRATCDVSAVFLVCKGMTRLRCEDMSRDVCRPETQPQVQQSPPPPHHQPGHDKVEVRGHNFTNNPPKKSTVLVLEAPCLGQKSYFVLWLGPFLIRIAVGILGSSWLMKQRFT